MSDQDGLRNKYLENQDGGAKKRKGKKCSL
jgi:hypothetical protein